MKAIAPPAKSAKTSGKPSTDKAIVPLRPASGSPRAPTLSAGRRPRPIVPETMEEAMTLARAVVASRMAPRGLETPEACMIAILHGLEVGLTPLMALQRIAVINGRPTIWGDGALALVRASGLCRSIREWMTGTKPDAWTAQCEVLRRGERKPVSRTFSVDDAKCAGLWGQPGPWTSFPRRMLQMRARAFALRDVFADVLGGLYLREELDDGAAPAPPKASEARLGSEHSSDRRTTTSETSAIEHGDVSPAPPPGFALRPVAAHRRPNPSGRGNSGWVRLRPPRDVVRLRAPAPPSLEGDERTEAQDAVASAPQPRRNDHDPTRGSDVELFDQALACARDAATLQEIEAEFEARLAELPREEARRAAHIRERHRARVADLGEEDRP